MNHSPRGFQATAFVIAAMAGLMAARPASQAPVATVFTNARVIAGAGPQAFAPMDAAFTVREGRIDWIGPRADLRAPAGARTVDLGGQFVIPGLISAHAHVSDVDGLRPRAYTEANARRQLGVYARYGITTVWSLGGEQAPAFALRDAQRAPGLDRARIFVAGEIVTARTPEDGRAAVARVAATRPDIIKIRVDDNLGATTKLAPEVYRAIIGEAHARGLRVAAHIFYLEDAKALLEASVDMIAHSVRDRDLDDETLMALKAGNVPYCPTLTREVSTFVYASTPGFFADPFFLREADRDVIAQLRQPARQQAMAASASAQRYKAGLDVAMRNLKRAADAGVIVAMGTDSGASADRFQGYFEHLELWMMADAGLTPAQVLRAATVDAARAIGRDDIGALAAGRWADFVVLGRNPLDDIRHSSSIAAVYIAGAPIDR